MVRILLISILVSGGGGQTGPASSVDAADHLAALAIWRAHGTVVEKSLQEEMPFDQSRFAAAVEFMENTSGIVSNTGTFAGRLPLEGFSKIVKRWQDWFSKHQHELRLDAATCRVTVRHGAKRPRS